MIIIAIKIIIIIIMERRMLDPLNHKKSRSICTIVSRYGMLAVSILEIRGSLEPRPFDKNVIPLTPGKVLHWCSKTIERST